MDKKSLYVPAEVKVNTEKRIIEGYASTFGNRDLVGDIVERGAFTKTVSERFAGGNKNDIKVLWQHYQPIGLPVHMEEDSKGLYTHSRIAKTPLGDEALALAAEGVVDKMSIGYDVIKHDWSGDTRLLKEVKLYEYSLVTFPANPEAGIEGVKAWEAFIDELKAGRVLSNANRGKVQTAIEALTALLEDAGEGEPDGKSTHKAGDDTIDEKTYNEILAELKSFKI